MGHIFGAGPNKLLWQRSNAKYPFKTKGQTHIERKPRHRCRAQVTPFFI